MRPSQEPARAAALAGPAGAQREAWGFKQRNQLLVFENLGHQRCLLQGVRAATAHQLGRGPASPPLASGDCEGIASQVQELLCARLKQACTSNPLAAVTGRWLACPTPSRAGSAAEGRLPGVIGAVRGGGTSSEVALFPSKPLRAIPSPPCTAITGFTRYSGRCPIWCASSSPRWSAVAHPPKASAPSC
jgi:hypothetical protein